MTFTLGFVLAGVVGFCAGLKWGDSIRTLEKEIADRYEAELHAEIKRLRIHVADIIGGKQS